MIKEAAGVHLEDSSNWEYEPMYEGSKGLSDKYMIIFFPNRNKDESFYGGIKLGSWLLQNIDLMVQIYNGNADSVDSFLQKVISNQELSDHVSLHPTALESLGVVISVYKKNLELFFEDPLKVDIFIKNDTQRENEHSSSSNGPEADYVPDEKEFSAGVPKSWLESQVADAVFLLRDKGYNSFESGFDPSYAVTGEQMITFKISNSTEISKCFIPDVLEITLKERGFKISLVDHSYTEEDGGPVEHETRMSIVPIPLRFVELSEWKEIWDIVAEAMPVISENRADPANLPVHKEFRYRFLKNG